jgi:Protein of unknown function (DUF3108)
MSHRVNAVVAALAAFVLVGAAFYWLHSRSAGAPTAIASAPVVAVPAPAADSSGAPEQPLPRESTPPPEARKKSPAPQPDAGVPLRAGEVLDFTADMAKVSNVANLRLQVAERRNFLGKNAWHLQAFAHTENPLRMVFELDDQFDSYSDAGTMSSLQYEMHLNERGQKVDSVQRMTSTGKDPAPANATEARILPGTRDPLGMMQYLRSVSWAKTPNVRGPVYDGHKLYDVQAALAGSAVAVTVPAGNFTTDKVEIRVFSNAEEMKDAHFYLYLDHSAARTPVLLEAVLPFATARVALKAVK